MKIGIIGAMDLEIATLKEQMDIEKRLRLHLWIFARELSQASQSCL